MTQHQHFEKVGGCFRCDLTDAELGAWRLPVKGHRDVATGLPVWPTVFSEDLETTCEYGPHPYHEVSIPDCDFWVPLGAIPGEPDFDEDYWDAKRDDYL